jgi:hypothetical protein
MPAKRLLAATITSINSRSSNGVCTFGRARLGANSERLVNPIALVAFCLVIPIDRSKPVVSWIAQLEGVIAFAVDGSVMLSAMKLAVIKQSG